MVLSVEIEASQEPSPNPIAVVVVAGALELLNQEIGRLGSAVPFLSLVVALSHNCDVKAGKG